MVRQYSSIYLTFSPILASKLIKQKIFKNDIYLKNFHGIYIETKNKDRYANFTLKEIKDNIYVSYNMIRIVNRFKRLKIKKGYKEDYTLPFFDNLDSNIRYIISTVDLIIRRYNLYDQKIDIYINKLQENYINKILERYFRKKYNAKLRFALIGKIIKPQKNIFYSMKPYKLSSLFSILKIIPYRKKKNLEDFNKKNILEVGSIKTNEGPYRIPYKEKNLKNIASRIDINNLCKYGLNKYESIFFLLLSMLILINKLKLKDIYKIFKYSLFIDYIQIFINKLYIYNLSIFLKNINIYYLFCSHRSLKFEELIYKACKNSRVISISNDFSLGYPCKNIYKKEISLTAKPDIYLVSSSLTKEHYNNANKDYINSGNQLKIINCNCIQVEYARKNSKNINKNKNIIFSIFDNNYGENIALKFQYADELVNLLSNHKKWLSCIVHSKANNIYLEDQIKQYHINYSRAKKGDFSPAINSNLIISVGFQGAAIKAAFAFKKPIIFFCPEKNYFKDIFFSSDKKHNEKVIKVFNKLFLDNLEVKTLLSFNKSIFYAELEKLNKLSNQFFELIGISNKLINTISYLENLEKLNK